MEYLHSGARWIFRFRVYYVLLFIGFAITVWASGFFVPLYLSIGNAIIFVLVFYILFIIVLGEIYARLSYQFWKYEFTNNEIKIEKGIIWKNYKSIPYERIQNVDIHRGILARIIGFSTLDIQTAGYSGDNGRGIAEAHIPAVARDGAEQIRAFIIKKFGKKSGV